MTELLPEAAFNPVVHNPQFTSRQLEILQAICYGKSIHDISLDLFISVNTVKYHLKLLFKQLHVHNRAMLVRLALLHGWVK